MTSTPSLATINRILDSVEPRVSSKAQSHFQRNKEKYRDYVKKTFTARVERDKPVEGKTIDGTALIDAAAEIFTRIVTVPGERTVEAGLSRTRGNRILLNLTIHDENRKILARAELSFTQAQRDTYAGMMIVVTGYPDLRQLVKMGVHKPGEGYTGNFDNLFMGAANTSPKAIALSLRAAESIEHHWPDLVKNAAL